MGRPRPSLAFRLATLAVGVCVAVPLGASVEAIEHLGRHVDPSGPVHAEAAHPDAAPHLDAEEHLHAEGCVVCAHGSTTVATPAPADSETPPETVRSSSGLDPRTRSTERSSSPARAPPA